MVQQRAKHSNYPSATKHASSLCGSQDIFSLILPHLSFKEILRCTEVCKDWRNAPRNYIIKCVFPIHYLPDQMPLLLRIKVEGLKLYSRKDVNRLIPLYNEHFSHTKELQMWVEEESVIRISNADRQDPAEMEILNCVANRAQELFTTIASSVSFHSLRHLEIGCLVLSPIACTMFAKIIQSMPSLQELHFQYLLFTDGNDGAVWDALEVSESLEKLRFVIVKGQSSFHRVPKNLKTLDAHRIGMTGQSAMQLMQNLPPHSIETVIMHGFWNDARFAFAEMMQYDLLNLSHLTHMHTLHLLNVDMSPSDLSHLMPRLPASLKRLNVSCNYFLGGGGMVQAFENGARLPESVTWLDISSSSLNDRDLRCVVHCCMDTLETLILDGNEDLFGRPRPNPIHVLVFCEIVQALASKKLKSISCRNCGWDAVNPDTRQFKYPELLALTEDVAVWGDAFKKK